MKKALYGFRFAMMDDDFISDAVCGLDGNGDKHISIFQAKTQEAADNATKCLLSLLLDLTERLKSGEIECKVGEWYD